MGQQSSEQSKVKEDYTVVKAISNGQFLVKRKRGGNQLQLRILNFPLQQQMLEYLKLLERRKKIKNPHLLELIQCQRVVDQYMCSSTFKLRLVTQLPFKTLKEDIRQRSNSKPRKYFNQDQLWSILYSCCHALYSLYINKFSHESLTTNQIYIDTAGIIKLGDVVLINGTKNYLSLMDDQINEDDIRYISPELKNLVDENNFYSYEKEKSDVFILAAIILEMGNLSQIKYYDLTSKKFNFDAFFQAFQEFKQRYSVKIHEIILRMLTFDYKTRPRFENIIQSIEQKTIHTSSNISSKDSSMIHQIDENMKEMLKNTNKSMNNNNNFATFELTQVKQKLNFDANPPNLMINYTQPIRFDGNLILRQASIANMAPNTNPMRPNDQTIVRNIQENQPYLPNIIQQNFIKNQVTKDENKGKFDTVIRNIKRQNQQNYTPYQHLANLSGKAPPQNHYHAQKEITGFPNVTQTNNFSFIPPTFPKLQATDNNLKQRRFSELKFGGIDLRGLLQEQPTKDIPTNSIKHENKQINITPSRQEPKQKNKMQQKNSFIIQQNENGKYEGFKVNGKKNGIGRIYYADGGSYEGQWKDNMMQGYGKLYYPDGKTAYQGYWLEDQFNGTGRVYNDQPEKNTPGVVINYTNFSDLGQKWLYYQGEFQKDSRHGKGMMKFITGQKFYGNFNSDVIEGEGTFHMNNGDIIQGIWSKNIFITS